MSSHESVEISTDPARLELALISDFLASSYWAAERTRAQVEQSIRGSLCFGAYVEGRQVGFARVVTDSATFGYLADVFVVPAWRRRGISKQLLGEVLAHPQLCGVRLLLRTRDAHGLYRQFGFQPVDEPEWFMMRSSQHRGHGSA